MQKALAEDGDIAIDAPHGDAWVKEESDRPLLLVAGGTGFSYVRSILDHCIAQNSQKEIHLYWGAKDERQLYAKAELTEIAEKHSNVHFVPVVEDAPAAWNGQTGNVLEAINHNFESLADYDIYIAGRFEMAGAAREQFTEKKDAKREHMYADAYAFI